METSQWDRYRRGEDCPFDLPRADVSHHWDWVGRLPTSTLYLTKNQTYRGQCLLILDLRHATRPSELSLNEWTAFCADLHRAEAVIASVTKSYHINLAALGNLVPHLHWHIIPRYREDPRWGGPIWPELPAVTCSEKGRTELLRALRDALAATPPD